MNNLLWMTIKLEFEWEIFLLLTYCCFSCSLIFKGFKRPLTDADLWALNKTNRSSAVVPPFVKKFRPHLHMGMKGFISLKVFIMNNLLWMTIKLEFEWEIFLLLTYCCFSCSLIFKGFKRPLTDADLWALNKTNRSSAVVPPFVKKWKEAESSIRWSAMIIHEIRNLFSCSA